MSVDLRKFVTKIIKVIPGPYWGLFSIIASSLGVIIAILMTPGYTMSRMMSHLGTSPGALFFNLGMILAGLFTLVFYLYLAPILKSENVKVGIHRTALVFAILFCVFYTFIGVIPSVANSSLEIAHGLVSMICLIFGAIHKSLFGYMMLKSEKFLKFHVYSAISVAALEIIFLLTWIPLIEWIMVFAINYWIFIISFHLFTRKDLFYY